MSNTQSVAGNLKAPSIVEELAAHGFRFTIKADNAASLKYVLMIVIDTERDEVVTLVKTRGPEHLLGKITFPGGRVEASESMAEAAAREMREETGIDIPANDWLYLARSEQVGVFIANGPAALAETKEDEVVTVMKVSEAVELSRTSGLYAPDFNALLVSAWHTL